MAKKKNGEEIKTNPNGANQYLLDPRQKLCWENYSNPKSPTFGNATQSAVSAGYEYDYADQITMTEWFKGKVWRLNGTFKGEKKIDELINLPIKNDAGYDVGIIRVQADLAKYLTSTLGKNEGYTTKVEQEHTNPDGNLKTIVINRNYAGDDKPTS